MNDTRMVIPLEFPESKIPVEITLIGTAHVSRETWAVPMRIISMGILAPDGSLGSALSREITILVSFMQTPGINWISGSGQL